MTTVFDGKNIVPGMPDELARAVTFLTEKEKEGSFVYGTSFEDWNDVDEIIKKPLDLGFQSNLIAYAIGLAYIVSRSDGLLTFSDNCNMWTLAYALAYIAPLSGWDTICMATVVNSFQQVSEDVEVNIENAVQAYCRTYFDNGLQLLELLPKYRQSILAGLLECDMDRTIEHCPQLNDVDLLIRTVCHTTHLPDESICKVYDRSNDSNACPASEILTFWLMASDRMDETRNSNCKAKILNLLEGCTTPYVTPICRWVLIQRELTTFAEDCLLALVHGLDKSSIVQSLHAIDNVVVRHDTRDDFIIKLIGCVADNYGPDNVLVLDRCLRNYSQHEDDFLQFVLSFILHVKGKYRVVGRKLWDDYHLESSSFEPETMPEELQCVFIVFMLQDLGNPETRLPKILPLFNSKSDLVINALLSEIRPYADEYMGHVSKAIDDAGVDTEQTRALKKYIDDRHKSIEKRRGLKELSPKYAQYHIYQEAIRTQNAKIKQHVEQMEEGSDKGIWGLFKRQVLARGGGWRKEDGTTQHLLPIKVSVPAGIMRPSMMPYERIKWNEKLMKDYETA